MPLYALWLCLNHASLQSLCLYVAAADMASRPSGWFLPRPVRIHHMVEDFLTTWQSAQAHILPLRRFFEACMQADLRNFDMDDCFYLSLTHRHLPVTCSHWDLHGQGVRAPGSIGIVQNFFQQHRTLTTSWECALCLLRGAGVNEIYSWGAALGGEGISVGFLSSDSLYQVIFYQMRFIFLNSRWITPAKLPTLPNIHWLKCSASDFNTMYCCSMQSWYLINVWHYPFFLSLLTTQNLIYGCFRTSIIQFLLWGNCHTMWC